MQESPFDTIGDEPIEARIVSWVLGEASAFEAAELERLCEERPELLVFRRRMRALHGLLTEAEAAEPDLSWKLPAEKRAALDEIFGETKIIPLESDKDLQARRSGRRALWAIAACVALTLFLIRWVKPGAFSPSPDMAEERVVFSMSAGGAGAAGPEKTEAELVELDKAVRDQEAKVEERRKVLSTIVRTKGIIYKGQDSLAANEDQGAQEALETYSKLSEDKKQLEGNINSLLKYDSDQLITYASGLDLPDNVIKNLYPEYQERQLKVAELKTKGFGDSHPQVVAAKEQAQGLKRQMDEGVVNLRATLQSELAQTTDRLKSVEVRKNDSREEAIRHGLDAQDYVDAKRDFETDQELLQQMKLKQVEKSIELKGSSQSLAMNDGNSRATAGEKGKKDLSNLEFEGYVDQGAPLAGAAPAAPSIEMPLFKKDQADIVSKSSLSSRSRSKLAPAQAERSISNSPVSGAVSLADSREKLADGPSDAFAEKASISPVEGTSVDGIPAEPDQLALNGVTNGLRSGDQAIKHNSIDAVLNNPNRTRSATAAPAAEPESESVAKDSLPMAGSGSGGGRPAISAKPMDSSAAADRFARNDSGVATSGPAQPQAATASPAKPSAVGGMVDGDKSQLATDDLAFKSLEDHEPRYAQWNFTGGAMRSPVSNEELKALETLGVHGLKSESAASDQTVIAGSEMHLRTGLEPAAADEASSSSAYYDRRAGKDEGGKAKLQNVDKIRSGLYTAEGNLNLGKYDQAKEEYTKVLEADPYNSAARRGMEKVESAKTDYYRAAYDHTRAELLMQVDAAWELAVPSDAEKNKEMAEPATPETALAEKQKLGVEETQEFQLPGATNEYLFRGMDLSKADAAPAKKTPLESMEEIAATEEPYSTFSLNINDASFQIAKAALDKGERPDPTAIKVEQFYNAVDYGDPAPASNEPVAALIEQSAHPIIPGRNMVRVALKTAAAGRGASQPLRLTLLVDQSGSMVREDRRTAMSNALKQLSGLLTANDHITVVGFSRESHLLADNMTGDQATKLGDLVNQTASEGGTNLEQALNLGEQMAARQHIAGEQNRIVLFTDGAANLGNANPERLAERVKSLRQKGIAFDIAGIGADGVNDRLLGELTRHGNGRYYVVGDEKNDSFARQLAGAFRPAAENVKVQVHFNPERVGNYKLIGFEKDRLKTEDFRNDSVDAAELAAEEAGVAIYQVETLPQGTGEIGEVSVRFRDTSKGEMVERKWTMPFESTALPFDRATPSMQLAGLSMLAAEKLKGGPLADAVDFNQLTGPRSLVKQFYGSSARVTDMLHVIDAIK